MQSPGLQTLFPFPGRKWLNPYPGGGTPPLPLDHLELCGRECLKVSAFLRFLLKSCVCPCDPSAQAPPPERRQIALDSCRGEGQRCPGSLPPASPPPCWPSPLCRFLRLCEGEGLPEVHRPPYRWYGAHSVLNDQSFSISPKVLVLRNTARLLN